MKQWQLHSNKTKVKLCSVSQLFKLHEETFLTSDGSLVSVDPTPRLPLTCNDISEIIFELTRTLLSVVIRFPIFSLLYIKSKRVLPGQLLTGLK